MATVIENRFVACYQSDCQLRRAICYRPKQTASSPGECDHVGADRAVMSSRECLDVLRQRLRGGHMGDDGELVVVVVRRPVSRDDDDGDPSNVTVRLRVMSDASWPALELHSVEFVRSV